MYRRVVEGFRRYFFRGLVAFLPIALTVWVLTAVIRVMERGQDFLPRQLRPDQYLPFYVPGLGAISTVVLILLIGVVVTHFVSHKARDLWDRALRRIPFVSTLYRAIHQVVEAVVTRDTQSFRRVVLVEYPRKGLYAIGLVTGTPGGEIAERLGEELLSVYIPKAPNPTNGWYAIIPERETIPLAMSIEEAFKVIMSGGLVLPAREAEIESRIPKRIAN
ncbi:MAG: DUF502 domain-containing protein [Candidatus Binatia bacterium]